MFNSKPKESPKTVSPEEKRVVRIFLGILLNALGCFFIDFENIKRSSSLILAAFFIGLGSLLLIWRMIVMRHLPALLSSCLFQFQETRNHISALNIVCERKPIKRPYWAILIILVKVIIYDGSDVGRMSSSLPYLAPVLVLILAMIFAYPRILRVQERTCALLADGRFLLFSNCDHMFIKCKPVQFVRTVYIRVENETLCFLEFHLHNGTPIIVGIPDGTRPSEVENKSKSLGYKFKSAVTFQSIDAYKTSSNHRTPPKVQRTAFLDSIHHSEGHL